MDRRSADWQLLAVGRVADCQSALQPVANRRYTLDVVCSQVHGLNAR